MVGASANGCVYEHRSKRDSRGASTEVYHKEYERRGSCVDVERKTLDIKRQMERGMAKFHKKVGEKFVIYFQAYTNTYGDPAYLERIWREALEEESVVGISIATRPDCLGIPGVSVAVKKRRWLQWRTSPEMQRQLFRYSEDCKGVCREWQIHLD